MYQVSYMTNNGKDKWSIHETLEGAKQEAKLLKKHSLQRIKQWKRIMRSL